MTKEEALEVVKIFEKAIDSVVDRELEIFQGIDRAIFWHKIASNSFGSITKMVTVPDESLLALVNICKASATVSTTVVLKEIYKLFPMFEEVAHNDKKQTEQAQ